MTASARRFVSTALGFLLIGVATPVVAEAATHSRVELDDGSTITYNPTTNQYCRTYSVTGSHIERKECKTQEDWAKLGLMIAHK
jgi:hypothetical protein